MPWEITKEYGYRVAGTSTLQNLLESFYMALSFIEKSSLGTPDNLADRGNDHGGGEFYGEVFNNLLEGYNRPVVLQLSLRFTDLDTDEELVVTYGLAFFFELSVYHKNYNFYTIQVKMFEWPRDRHGNLKKDIIKTTFRDHFGIQFADFDEWDIEDPKLTLTIAYPDLTHRTICRAMRGGLTQFFMSLVPRLARQIGVHVEDFNKDMSYFETFMCPKAFHPPKIRERTSVANAYGFTCEEFKAYLSSYIENLGDDTVLKESFLFILLKGEWMERAKNLFEAFRFRCSLSDGNERDIPSTFGSGTGPTGLKQVFIRFYDRYDVPPDNDAESVVSEWERFAFTFNDKCLRMITTEEKKKKVDVMYRVPERPQQAFTTYKEEYTANQNNPSPDKEFNSMCYSGELRLSQNTQSFMDCFRYVKFAKSVSMSSVMSWKYRRVLLYYFDSITVIQLSMDHGLTPKYILGRLMSSGGWMKLVKVGGNESSPTDDDSTVLTYLMVTGFPGVPVRLEIHVSNTYYVTLTIRTSHNLFELTIDRYPLFALVHHIVRTGKADGFTYAPENQKAQTAISKFPQPINMQSLTTFLDSVREAVFEAQYLPSIIEHLQHLATPDIGKREVMDSWLPSAVALPGCLSPFDKSDLVGFPVFVVAMESILAKTRFDIPETNEEGEFKESWTILKVADSTKHIESISDFLDPTSFMPNTKSGQAGKDDPQLTFLAKNPGVVISDDHLCEKFKDLEAAYAKGFVANYAALYQVKDTNHYFLLRMGSYESDDMFIFHWTFKCMYFHQEYAMPYASLGDLLPVIKESIQEKLVHLHRSIKAHASSNPSKEKMADNAKEIAVDLVAELDTAVKGVEAVKDCVVLAKELYPTKSADLGFILRDFNYEENVQRYATKAYCVTHTREGKSTLFNYFLEKIRPVAVVYVDSSLNAVGVRMPVRSVRNIFRSPQIGKTSVEMIMGDFKFPYRKAKPGDKLVKLFAEEVARRIRFNVSVLG
jgi:hypothetical protein